jgi:protein O-GlcNAc transferase
MPRISEAVVLAKKHHQAGQLQVAEQICQQLLAADPNQSEALHLLGVIAFQTGRYQPALAFLQRAIEQDGTQADFHNNLGGVYRALRRFGEARSCYQRALELKPDFAGFHKNLGMTLWNLGQRAEAVVCFRRVVALQPDNAEAHHTLGDTLKEHGQISEAIGCFQQALRIKPDMAKTHHNLGVAYQHQGQLAEAIASYHRALQIQPDFAETHHNLGAALNALQQTDEAVTCYRRALQLQATYVPVLNNLGNALVSRGELAEATVCFRRALELQPNLAEAHNNLGNVLKDQGHWAAAISCYQKALRLEPNLAWSYSNLGTVWQAQGKLDEAFSCCQRALHLQPHNAPFHLNLGSVLKDQGRLTEAIACFQQALDLDPDYAHAHSNLISTHLYYPGNDAATLYDMHRAWNQRHAEPLTQFIQPHANNRSGQRRLRIGYVSPDFSYHPVGRFLLPLLTKHDRTCFEVFCYSSVKVADEVTSQCRQHADVWRNVAAFSDEKLAGTIRKDQIDVLVDLTMHLAGNRLLVFARKPAPVQVTYLAYCGTTGLDTMDYRLTDPYMDPPGQNDSFYAEKSVRLPNTYWCYQPVGQMAVPNVLPSLQNGQLTFGSLNNFCKVTEPTLEAWSRLLDATPGTRLLLHVPEGRCRERVQELFVRRGVSPDRVQFLGKVSLADYLQTYQRIDVALDPFPYVGGTTTCDALWMGVPVVSLAGSTAVSRGGLSILSNIGLANLVAHHIDEYVGIARDLAGDLPRLRSYRATMRDRIQGAPLMDASQFTRNVEAAYRKMWQDWCAQLS